MLNLRQLASELNKLIVYKEATDPRYLHTIFVRNPDFMRYQYALSALKSSVYNNVCLRYRHYERVRTLLMLTLDAKSILDVGCGYGDLSLELASRGKDVVLLDIDLQRLAVAKHRFRKFGLKGEFIHSDAHYLPFRDNSFDSVFSNQVVEHVKEPIGILKEKLRVSRLRAIVICGNTLQLPITRFVYYKILSRKEPEIVPDLGSYDEKYYLNYQIPPFNNRIAILLAVIVGHTPVLRTFLAGNVAKVYHKWGSNLSGRNPCGRESKMQLVPWK